MKLTVPFLVSLRLKGVLDETQLAAVMKDRPTYEQSCHILTYVKQGTKESFQQFLNILDETGQEHLALSLKENTSKIIFVKSSYILPPII